MLVSSAPPQPKGDTRHPACNPIQNQAAPKQRKTILKIMLNSRLSIAAFPRDHQVLRTHIKHNIDIVRCTCVLSQTSMFLEVRVPTPKTLQPWTLHCGFQWGSRQVVYPQSCEDLTYVGSTCSEIQLLLFTVVLYQHQLI